MQAQRPEVEGRLCPEPSGTLHNTHGSVLTGGQSSWNTAEPCANTKGTLDWSCSGGPPLMQTPARGMVLLTREESDRTSLAPSR